jgi:hypothetical protein
MSLGERSLRTRSSLTISTIEHIWTLRALRNLMPRRTIFLGGAGRSRSLTVCWAGPYRLSFSDSYILNSSDPFSNDSSHPPLALHVVRMTRRFSFLQLWGGSEGDRGASVLALGFETMYGSRSACSVIGASVRWDLCIQWRTGFSNGLMTCSST